MHIHRWGQWSEIKEATLPYYDHTVDVQDRQCTKCGKVERRRVSS